MGLRKGWWPYLSCIISLQLSTSSTKPGGHFVKIFAFQEWMSTFAWGKNIVADHFLNWQVKVIFEFLKSGFQEISSSLDLSFEDDSVADEKIPFLAYLARVLKENSYFPYEPPAGCNSFCNLIAAFLKTYHHIPLTSDVRKHSWLLTFLPFCFPG